MAEIGIIIPVYNVEGYLRTCLDSILQQTFQNFEIILVDDGSTDKSGAICDEYAERNKKITVIHKENEGVSSARNRGLEENANELLAFIDPDDWIEKRYLEVLYHLFRDQYADLVISGGIDVLEGPKSDKTGAGEEKPIPKADLISRSEAYRRMFVCENGISVVAWAKLYHKKLFEEVRYPQGEISEDSGIIDRIIEKCDRIVCTSYAGYYHLRRKGSLMHRKMSWEHRAGVENAGYLLNFIKAYYPDIEDAAKIFYYNNCLQLINLMVLESEVRYGDMCRQLKKIVLKDLPFFICSRYTKTEEKCAAVCLLFGTSWYRFVWKKYLGITGKDLSGT